MAPKIKIPVRRTGRALAHLHSKPSPHTRLVPHFAGTLRSPQIEMRSAHGWRQPELHFGEARTRFPASREPPCSDSQEPCLTSDPMRLQRGWRQRTLFNQQKAGHPNRMSCFNMERATRLARSTAVPRHAQRATNAPLGRFLASLAPCSPLCPLEPKNRRFCAVQAFCAAKPWRRANSLRPSILISCRNPKKRSQHML